MQKDVVGSNIATCVCDDDTSKHVPRLSRDLEMVFCLDRNETRDTEVRD